MSNYNIGLSGLRSNSEAIDTISNNISNAATVGYKMGDFVFQDQFYKAVNPLDPARAGMGVAKQNIRRIFTQGAVQSSANNLDMAITGATGMFRLATKTDPTVSETYYTRNGQFAVSRDVDVSDPKRNYIVNENGMHLTGYISADGTTLSDSWTNPLTMPPTTLDPKTTTDATLSVNLDARTLAFRVTGTGTVADPYVPPPAFNPLDSTTYTNKISQTVYSKEDGGQAHTLTTYFRRIEDAEVPVTFDGTNFSYSPTSAAQPNVDPPPAKVTLGPDVGRSLSRLTPDGAPTDVYAITLTDGSIFQLSVTAAGATEFDNYSELIAAPAANRPSFTLVTSQYEVYAQLDDEVYNDTTIAAANREFFSDKTLAAGEVPTGTGARQYTPIAVLRFAGGRNIDTAAVDPVTFDATFQTKVGLVGKVSTMGENAGTDRPDLKFDLDLSRINNFATPFSVEETSQNGNSVSLLNSVTIDNEGRIVGVYGDGRTYMAGQLVLVNFSATNGLAPSGNNVFAATYLSGSEVSAGVIVGKPGENGLSGVRAGSVEASNVDLANELVKLLIQQRMYSANSQSIRAFDETLTTTIRMTGG